MKCIVLWLDWSALCLAPAIALASPLPCCVRLRISYACLKYWVCHTYVPLAAAYVRMLLHLHPEGYLLSTLA